MQGWFVSARAFPLPGQAVSGHWAGWTVAASWVLRVSLSHSDLDIQVMSNRILALTDGAPSDSLRSGQTHSTPHSQCQSRTSPSNSQDE